MNELLHHNLPVPYFKQHMHALTIILFMAQTLRVICSKAFKPPTLDELSVESVIFK